MIVEKLLVSLLLLIPFVQTLGSSILEPLADVSETLELWMALLIMPLLINVLWFWVVDNLLMKAEAAYLGPTLAGPGGAEGTGYELLVQHSPAASEDEDEVPELDVE